MLVNSSRPTPGKEFNTRWQHTYFYILYIVQLYRRDSTSCRFFLKEGLFRRVLKTIKAVCF